MATPDIAPSVSPIVIARVVPAACEHVPIAVPIATGFFILKALPYMVR